MKITANEEYGLRVILQLAKILESKKSKGERDLVTLSEISEAEQISSDYAAQILLKLKKGCIVESVRGKKGGYRLSKTASQIDLLEIMQALSDEAFADDFCNNHSGSVEVCAHSKECSIRPVWSTISSMVSNYFKSIRLQELLGSEQTVHSELKGRDLCHS